MPGVPVEGLKCKHTEKIGSKQALYAEDELP